MVRLTACAPERRTAARDNEKHHGGLKKKRPMSAVIGIRSEKMIGLLAALLSEILPKKRAGSAVIWMM